MSRLWITWESQRRNQSTSSALNAKLIEIALEDSRFLRYGKSIAITIKAVWIERPALLFVQNPSIVLSSLAILIGAVSPIKIVIDAHNSGLRPLEGRSRFFNAWADRLARYADLTIVTSDVLCAHVTTVGGRPALLPDPIPILKAPLELKRLVGKHNVLFICSWADDEPYVDVIAAAKLIASSTFIYITGNWKKRAAELPAILPDNVVLTGFVSNTEFDQLLFSADVILDLTTRDDCMVCGAYEGVAAEKPLILSSSPVLEAYFDKATIYTANNTESIAEAIDYAIASLDSLKAESVKFRVELGQRWEKLKLNLESHLTQLLKE